MQVIQLFIDGEFRNSSDEVTFDSLNPCTGEVIAKCHRPSAKDIDDAVGAASNALARPEWKAMPQEKRAEILLNIAELLKARKKEFIAAEIADSGSVQRKATADLFNAASFFKVMSKVAQNFTFNQVDEAASRAGFSKNSRLYSPIGVCAQIIPWNFPLVMAAWKIGPILATGCTTVLKTASETPASAMLLAEVLKEAGVPAGVVNIVTGDAAEGQQLINHPLVNKVAFTGSTAVGQKILAQTASSIKKTTMELGGKSANIILNDADLDIAVDGALYGYLYHAGQACDSGSRILVQEDIYPAFIERFKTRAAAIKIGDTQDPTVGLGPVINEKQFNSIMALIEKTKSEKAPLICGGTRLTQDALAKGYFIAPTAFAITPDNTIWHEEVFGPVAGITKFKTIAEAIDLANNSRYGLAGAVWSKDPDKAQEIAQQLEAGTVWINEYHLLNPGMPFGGHKQSGLGRELGVEGLMAYLEVKHLWVSECNTRAQKPWYDALF